jgi:Universal stress protein family
MPDAHPPAQNFTGTADYSPLERAGAPATNRRTGLCARPHAGRIFAQPISMITIERILVATDFGPASESALRYGRELARSFGAALRVLHVTENVFARAFDLYGYVPVELQQEVEILKRHETEALLDEEDRRELARSIVLPPEAIAPAIAAIVRGQPVAQPRAT